MAGFLMIVTWIFYAAPDQRIQLLKNFAIMGGLLVATVLTLIFLPAMYVAWFRIR